MNFAILDRHRVSFHGFDSPYILISITEPENNFPKLPDNYPYRKKTLRLKFDDMDANVDSVDNKRLPKYFDEEKANQIIKFVMDYQEKVNLVVCQCDGGISRSSATAAALSVIFNGPKSDNWIFNSNKYIPNMVVYRTILNYYAEKLMEV